MNCSQQEALISKEVCYEVFDKNKNIRFGITSKSDRQKIEEKNPGKYVFKKFDYIDLERLEEQSKVTLKLSLLEKVMFVTFLLSICLSIGCLFLFRSIYE